jgi:hypothetical protein
MGVLNGERGGQENPMPIKEGDKVDYEGEAFTVLRIYSESQLLQSSVLLKSMDGTKSLLTGVSSLNKDLPKGKEKRSKL